MYSIEFSNAARRQLKKFNKESKEQIKLALEKTRLNPRKYFRKLKVNNTYRFRTGNFRIVADIIDKKLVILIIKLGLRKKIYNR